MEAALHSYIGNMCGLKMGEVWGVGRRLRTKHFEEYLPAQIIT